MRILNRNMNDIPEILCKTCGRLAKQNRVLEFEDPSLIKLKRYKKTKKKTWARLIKPSFHITYNGNRKLRNKRLFYSSLLLDCIKKRHKFRVVFKDKRRFPESYKDRLVYSADYFDE